jgi:hypothetical protein
VSWVTSGTGGLLVPDSLLGFVLRLLGRIAEPVFAPDVVGCNSRERMSPIMVLLATQAATAGCLPWLAGTGRDPRTTTWPWTHRRQG